MDNQTRSNIGQLLSTFAINRSPGEIIRSHYEFAHDYQLVSYLLQADNPLHAMLMKSLTYNMIQEINSSLNVKNKPQKRIKYKSCVNVNDLDNVIHFSLWKSIPTTINLFSGIESKKQNCVKINGNKSSLSINESNNEEDVPSFKKNKACSGTYMDMRPINLKRKCNIQEEEDNEENNYNTFQQSIYNVNKKKKKQKIRLNEDEENLNDNEIGFKSAATALTKKNQNRDITNENDEAKINNSNNAVTKQQSTLTKKFNPPVKNGNGKKDFELKQEDADKEKELDEKLKGFDKKLIEFIESEILNFSPNVSWEDIAGLEFAKKTIKEIIIWPLLRPDIFNGIRRPPKGLLLFGPPGTGKTMIAKAIASESKSKFFNISASSLMSKWIGESEKLVRTLFALAAYYQPSVVFIDEIDSILTARSENECEASRRLKTEFLVQLDGAGTNQDDRILIIGATNRPQEIDDAFIRRLSKRLYIPLPNRLSRKQLIANVVTKEKEKKNKYDISEDEVNEIVRLTRGYSGSDMINVCREAAMMPIRSVEDIFNINLDNLRGVNFDDFIKSIAIVKPSVSEKSISQYITWNKDFGSFQLEEKEIDF